MFGRREKKSVVADMNYIDYKDVDLLHKVLTGGGKLTSRRQIGCDSRMQHRIKRAVHQARYMALLPYGQ
ncbi:MAG: 30S ribosomal protein S18 [Bacillota bacterium]|jgi:small subunit ribosomal protein S18|nr:MAG: 30S ribosomal protein S18 [Planctomycetota bacterium]RUA09827.1 MAG: 30S ribosomal protein S18 [Bacillota bacterium]